MMVEELLMQEREEWIEEGKAIGRLETKAADIGSVLQLKGDIPREMLRKIRLIEDINVLDEIFQYSLRHDSLKEISDYLDGIIATA